MQHAPRIQVLRWAGWASGLDSPQAWRTWLAEPHALSGGGQPPLAEMPAMMRRRIDPLGRAALQAAWWAQGADAGSMPVIFASRWGEIARSLTLLQQLSADEPLSPTQFSLSVHNASGALYSMARQDRSNYLAVAAGPLSAEAALCEGLGLLVDGATHVLLVSFDAPLPQAYAALDQVRAQDEAPMLHAWACVLALAPPGQAGVHLEALAGASDALPARLPGNLSLLSFLVEACDALRGGAWPSPLTRVTSDGGWRLSYSNTAVP